MEISLEQKEGGSVALFINGDLQFDSSDECIYHEALALPALAVVAARVSTPLRVLVIGGGDGLVAREIFKSERVATLDLVDYDNEILALAKSQFASFNCGSMLDPRISLHVQDAWQFVDHAIENVTLYDLIVSDLTVAETAMEARFHSVDWYCKLSRLLSEHGVLAINAVSPQATPQAYWCVFNSVLKSGMQARPFHIQLPSFSQAGFGDDWGFFIASGRAVTDAELLNANFPTNHTLTVSGTNILQKLFALPEELFAYQPKALPALVGSDILLHYFNNAEPLSLLSGVCRQDFALDCRDLFVPEADSGSHILPPEICQALAHSINLSQSCDSKNPENFQLFLHQVLDLMPSLQREQTAEVIEDFLEAPARFLQAIDLPGLVARLLRRAAELPAHLVEELELLQSKLFDWADDQENLMLLGHRVISILILTVVVGNLFYPDSVYAKGSHSASYGRRGGWGGGSTTYYNRGYLTPVNKGPIGPGPNDAAVKRMQKQGSLPQKNVISEAEYIDENGHCYPVRYYTSASSMGHFSRYRLGPGADIIEGGAVAMNLTAGAYLLLTPQSSQIVDQKNGHIVMTLQNDSALEIETKAEISRQLRQLTSSFEPGDSIGRLPAEAADKAIRHLQEAQTLFAGSDSAAATVASEAMVDVFPSVYLTADGQYVVIRRESGELAYLDGKNWYSDCGVSKLSEPYPAQFGTIAASYLAMKLRDSSATQKMLVADHAELAAYLDLLNSELKGYQTSLDDTVTFGTRKIARTEAIRLTQISIAKATLKSESLARQIQDMPINFDIAKIALTRFAAGVAPDRSV